MPHRQSLYAFIGMIAGPCIAIMRQNNSMIALLWAEDENGIIGRDNTLPWHLPSDLKYFKAETLNHKIVMGRKTFEGMGKRLLPKRETVILTHQKDYAIEGATVLNNVQDVLALDKEDEMLFVIGGSEIFSLFIPYADYLYQTKIHADFEGDTYFPTIDWTDWELVESKMGPVDEHNLYEHEFKIFKRAK
ncbi:dihydrofolate reductase [Trichococcus palustris]|jgi:dihydrofolate reductase|uniref:Dihydrofolate reductase n=2 Tax=Trichococcus palustris TaxID=140314 RepID=A0A143Y955_9LACT|nr:dihydrofolate reductase [Trichococcus palustris]SFK54519.1 dihydrofolate reductase [Trichococcus palustris]